MRSRADDQNASISGAPGLGGFVDIGDRGVVAEALTIRMLAALRAIRVRSIVLTVKTSALAAITLAITLTVLTAMTISGCGGSSQNGRVLGADNNFSADNDPDTDSALDADRARSDDSGVGSSNNAPHGDITLRLLTYPGAELGWNAIISALSETPTEIAVRVSSGASRDMSQAVIDGRYADIVNFSAEPDITRLVQVDKIAADWNQNVTKGVPFSSVMTLVVRPGNPKNIRDWDDLLAPDIEVVIPDPLQSTSAQWNLLAPYTVMSEGGRDRQAGLDFVHTLVTDHVRTQPASERDAMDAFLAGTGDVLISDESQALRVQRQGGDIDHIIPARTLKVDYPVAVMTISTHVHEARELNNFLYTPAGQRIWADAGFRPVDPEVAAEYAHRFPMPRQLWSITDLGGWSITDAALLGDGHGVLSQVYRRAIQ